LNREHLDKITDWWDGGTIHANALWIAGRPLSAEDVGDISGSTAPSVTNPLWTLKPNSTKH
jgi:hypothetical protein